jgi:acyl-CoA synthetase (NDP forming)
MRARELRPLFDPRSVAVLGASDDPAKWGNSVARSLLAAEHRRPVYLVSRGKTEVLGHRTYRSLGELPEPPELVVLVVPATVLEQAVGAALEAGARAIVAITAGLGERSGEGLAVERSVARRVRAAGAVLLGPNCMGVVDTATDLHAAPWVELPPGELALVAQSGNLSFDLGYRAGELGLGFSRFVSLGNQADLEVGEIVASCAEHEATRMVAVYCEDFRDGRGFARAALAAAEAGKPLILLAPGRTEAAARAARSHTGSLASSGAVVDAACRAAGIFRVHTTRELVELALALRPGLRARGRRVAIVTTGGGNGVIAADVTSAAGLEVPPPSDALAARVAALMPEPGSTANPVDLIGATLDDPGILTAVTGLVLESEEFDAVLLTGSPLALWHGFTEELEQLELAAPPELAAAAARAGKPLLLTTDRPWVPAARAALEARIPVYRDVESAVAVLARLTEAAEQPAEGVPDLPQPAEPPVTADGYLEARQLLATAGIPFPEARRVRELGEARVAAAELGYPVVLKALGLLHKSDQGGVVLGIASEEELVRSLADLATRLSPEAYSLERMAQLGEGVELIIGCRWEPRFGPVALAGMGGVYAELLRDLRLALAPVGEETAVRLLRGLRGAPLLDGLRGRPPVDLRAAARALAALSRLAAAHPELAEVEVNPLLVTPAGAVGLDARVVLRGDSRPTSDGGALELER